jgi:hypothetical protein
MSRTSSLTLGDATVLNVVHTVICVSPDMLFRGLFIASNPEVYLEILTGLLDG